MQNTVVLGSGEAELPAVFKCSCETIGILKLSEDWRMKLECQVMLDSSAALGVVQDKAEIAKLRYRTIQEPNILQT